MEFQELTKKVAAHVEHMFHKHEGTELAYHNFKHTAKVVEAGHQIAAHYQLNADDLFVVTVACWFHDTGYLLATPEEHEAKGAALATEYLSRHHAPPLLIEKVNTCIMATKNPAASQTLLEKITCDADVFHFGTDDFKKTNKLVRKEVEQRRNIKFTDLEWLKAAVGLLENHTYLTDYCQEIQKEGKLRNLARLHKKIAELPEDAKKDFSKNKTYSNPEEGEEKSKKNKEVRGVETMFRTTSTNHLRLSEMADNKANIMITINSIIVSVLMSFIIRKIESEPKILIPSILFLTNSLITVVMSILVTMPNVTSGKFSKEDIKNKTANLLFFGNFYKMDLKDYKWGIREMMNDSDFLYGSMTDDIYYLGVVLGKKYKMLRITYGIFMVGFSASVISYLVVVLTF